MLHYNITVTDEVAGDQQEFDDSSDSHADPDYAPEYSSESSTYAGLFLIKFVVVRVH